MGYFTGRVTFARYRVTGAPPGMFGPEHLERLQDHQAGRLRHTSADGVEIGWTAGDHILDTRFDLAKNIVQDTLHFALRIDAEKLPADLMRAYTQVELEALAAQNPSGRPSARQKREARDTARERLEAEAKDGRYLKRKAIEVLWDAPSNELLFGTASVTQVDRLFTLFERSFGLKFEPVTAGRQAYMLAEPHSLSRGVDDAAPSNFLPGVSTPDVAWVPDDTSRDFLGNEFLLWLWYVLDSEADSIKLGDNSTVSAMMARTLTLECPRGQTGHETITSEGPGRLPEARRAIQSGKLPRKAGLTLVRHDQQYEFTLHAEMLAVGSAKLPPPPDDAVEERARLEARVDQVRHLIETVDLLYDAFVRRRCGPEWGKELAKIQKWLARGDHNRIAG
jgi:hypothetical protein